MKTVCCYLLLINLVNRKRNNLGFLGQEQASKIEDGQ